MEFCGKQWIPNDIKKKNKMRIIQQCFSEIVRRVQFISTAFDQITQVSLLLEILSFEDVVQFSIIYSLILCSFEWCVSHDCSLCLLSWKNQYRKVLGGCWSIDYKKMVGLHFIVFVSPYQCRRKPLRYSSRSNYLMVNPNNLAISLLL